MLTAANLIYLGGFRVPSGPCGGIDGFGFGGKPLGYHAVNNSLFIGGHVNEYLVGEISIPIPVISSNILALPFATLIQSLADPVEGHLWDASTDLSTPMEWGGLLVTNGQLYGTVAMSYDANGTQLLSHYKRSLNLTTPSFTAWHRLNAVTGFVSGYLADVPMAWQTPLGGLAISGQFGLSIISRESYGPAAYAWTPSQLGVVADPLPCSALVYYPAAHQTLGPYDGSNPVWGGSATAAGCALIDDTALIFGCNGMGPFKYGPGTSDPALDGTPAPGGYFWCYDPTSGATGIHAYPYRYQVWATSLTDWAAVKAGTKQPWEVVPTTWGFELPIGEAPSDGLGGVGYNAAQRLLYVSQMRGDVDGFAYRPIIHVFRVTA